MDTHCHLDFPDYGSDLDEVLKRAASSGVERMIVPGTTIRSSLKAVELAEKHPEIFAACGIHPHDADKVTGEDIAALRNMVTRDGKVVAIG